MEEQERIACAEPKSFLGVAERLLIAPILVERPGEDVGDGDASRTLFIYCAGLRDCIIEAEKDRAGDEYTEQKLRELAEFFETTTAWYGQIRQWPTGALTRFVKLGDKARKLLGIGND